MTSSMRRGQKLVLGTVGPIASALVVWAIVHLMIEVSRFRYAENLILREKSRRESVWQVIETAKGSLIRAQNGQFRGWYLAADDSVSPISASPPSGLIWSTFPAKPGPYARNLYLRETKGPDCYWRITESPRGVHVQATSGRYESWYLDFVDDYRPETGINPRTAWNLALNPRAVEGTHWTIAATTGGCWIRATSGNFAGWFLDYLPEANVLEQRGGAPRPTRNRQAPPLAKTVD